MDIILAQKVANEARRTAVVVGGGGIVRIGIEKLYIGLPFEKVEKIVVREEILGLESIVEEVKSVNVDTSAVVGVAEVESETVKLGVSVKVEEVVEE